MTPLSAAAHDASAFADWARLQGCDITLLTDDDPKGPRPPVEVRLSDIFDAVEAIVEKRTYDQLVIYFSGHGILLAPGAEFWLLSRGPANPNEAINLLRSVEDARNCGIPHVVFVSDACRSAADTPALRAVTGGVVFPPKPPPVRRSEIDVYYATLPGDPANEVPQQDAIQAYRGLFTSCLLDVVASPPVGMPEPTVDAGATISVLSSRRLKDHLEDAVPIAAAAISIKLRQLPELRVETALPKYFARVAPSSARAAAPIPAATPTVGSALEALRASVFPGRGAAPSPASLSHASELGLTAELARLAGARGRERFETRTGFSIHGAQLVEATMLWWRADTPFREAPEPGAPVGPAVHVRLHSGGADYRRPSSIVLQFDGATGTVLPILPGFIGTVVVNAGSVVAVNFVPSGQTSRYQAYLERAQELEAMKAFASVASRNGRFEIERGQEVEFAARIRQEKGIDPIMGLYAAYAYAQAGRFEDAYSVFTYMREDEIELPIPFDVAMLALRYRADALSEPFVRVAPFAPMLAQGWSLLLPTDPMSRPIHQTLRPHLIPALFSTLDAEGVALARDYVMKGEKR